MKKIIAVTALVLAVILLTVGCARAGMIGKLVDEVVQGQKDETGAVVESQTAEDEPEPTKTAGETVDQGKKHSPEELFADYTEAKNNLIRNITQTIYEDPDLGFSWDPALINIYEVDAIMWAAFILWEDAAAVEQTGRFFGIQDFNVEKSKNRSIVSYTDDNGNKIVFTADYDEATDHYVFTSDHENGDKPYMEIIRTPYGLAGQSYTGGTGMLNNLYLISIEGENGIIGIIHDTEQPAPLTGKEAFDFPKDAGEWYHYEDGELTGINRNGEPLGG